MTIIELIIPKGTMVYTTHPKGDCISTRKQTIKIDDKKINTYRTEIHWAGSSYYWRWVKIKDIVGANPILNEYEYERDDNV